MFGTIAGVKVYATFTLVNVYYLDSTNNGDGLLTTQSLKLNLLRRLTKLGIGWANRGPRSIGGLRVISISCYGS